MPRASIAETLAKYAAVIGGLVTAIVAVAQLARGVSQSVREFEWKQAEEGRALVKTMLTDPAWDAMTMLDFSEGRTYEIAPDRNVLIRPADVVLALKNPTSEGAPERTETERFIIDRYDRLFFLVSQLQVAVRSDLVRKGRCVSTELVRREAALPAQTAASRLHEGECGARNHRFLRFA